MNKKVVHITYVLISFVLISIALFKGLSQVYVFFTSGADKGDMLMLSAKQINDYYRPKFQWIHQENEDGRPMEESTRIKIGKDYLASYFYQYQATGYGETKGLHDFFTNKSRDYVMELVNSYEEERHVNKGTTIEHQLELLFYSEDGTLIVLRDKALSYDLITDGEIEFGSYDVSTYEVMLLLEDNFWRIRHKVRVPDVATEVEIDSSIKRDISIQGNQFVKDSSNFKLKCVNYYPQDYPWQAMWQNFDSINFDNDFQLISELGFNSIRMFVPYEEFGAADVDPIRLSQLNKLLTIAEKHNLKVIVTLFDFFLGYSFEQWTLTDRHIEKVVNATKHQPALLAWDVKNEPNLDFESQGEDKVKRWLEFAAKRIRRYDSATYVTIGWSNIESHLILNELVDFTSFHFYEEPEKLANYMDSLTNISKPILIEEIGTHSYDKWWFPFSKSEEEQAEYVDQIFESFKNHDVSYAFWTLYDFNNIPSTVAGSAPWKRNPQKTFGLLDKDLNKKKVYDIITKHNN